MNDRPSWNEIMRQVRLAAADHMESLKGQELAAGARMGTIHTAILVLQAQLRREAMTPEEKTQHKYRYGKITCRFCRREIATCWSGHARRHVHTLGGNGALCPGSDRYYPHLDHRKDKNENPRR